MAWLSKLDVSTLMGVVDSVTVHILDNVLIHKLVVFSSSVVYISYEVKFYRKSFIELETTSTCSITTRGKMGLEMDEHVVVMELKLDAL